MSDLYSTLILQSYEPSGREEGDVAFLQGDIYIATVTDLPVVGRERLSRSMTGR